MEWVALMLGVVGAETENYLCKTEGFTLFSV